MYILSTLKIRESAEEVLRLPVSMVPGERDPDDVKVLMGTILNVWPASIFPGLGEPDLSSLDMDLDVSSLMEEPDLSSLDVEPDLSGLMVEPDLSGLNVELDLRMPEPDLGDLPEVMAALDKL